MKHAGHVKSSTVMNAELTHRTDLGTLGRQWRRRRQPMLATMMLMLPPLLFGRERPTYNSQACAIYIYI